MSQSFATSTSRLCRPVPDHARCRDAARRSGDQRLGPDHRHDRRAADRLGDLRCEQRDPRRQHAALLPHDRSRQQRGTRGARRAEHHAVHPERHQQPGPDRQCGGGGDGQPQSRGRRQFPTGRSGDRRARRDRATNGTENYTSTPPTGWTGSTGDVGAFAPSALDTIAFVGQDVAFINAGALSQTFTAPVVAGGPEPLLVSLDIGNRLQSPASGSVTVTASSGGSQILDQTVNIPATAGYETHLSYTTGDLSLTGQAVTLTITNNTTGQVNVGNVVVQAPVTVFNVGTETALNTAIEAIDASGSRCGPMAPRIRSTLRARSACRARSRRDQPADRRVAHHRGHVGRRQHEPSVRDHRRRRQPNAASSSTPATSRSRTWRSPTRKRSERPALRAAAAAPALAARCLSVLPPQ